MKVKSEREVAQSCLTLRDPMDRSLPGSSVHGIFQARVLEWGAIAFSVKLLSHVQLFTTPWTAAYQAPPSMGFSRQEHWSGLPSPCPLVYSTRCKYDEDRIFVWFFPAASPSLDHASGMVGAQKGTAE